MSRLEEKQKVMRVGVERTSCMHCAPTSFAHKQLLPKLNIDPFSPLPPARLDPPLLLLRYQYGIIKRKKKKTRTHTVALPNQQQEKHREKRKVTKLGRLIRENTAHIRR